MVIQLQTLMTIQPMMMVLIIWFLEVCLICLISHFTKDSRLSKIDYSPYWISDIMKTYVPIHSSVARKRCLQVPPLIRTESKIPIKQKHPSFPSIKSTYISSLYYKAFWHFLQYRRLHIENFTTCCGANSVHNNITEENPPQYVTSECSY
jgi:hypothetical protein